MKHKYPRFFINKTGFNDDSLFVKVDSNGNIRIMRKGGGYITDTYLKESDCENFCRDAWREIDAAELALIV